MRRTILLILVLVLGGGAAEVSAQSSFSIRGGVNLSTIDGDGLLADSEGRTGANIGLGLTFPLVEGFDVMLMGAYSGKGGEPKAGVENALSFSLRYVEFASLLTTELLSLGPVSVQLRAGPALGFEVACDLSVVSETGFSVEVPCDLYDAETDALSTNSPEFGAIGGVGLVYQAGESVRLFVDVLYEFGLTTVVDLGNGKNRLMTLQGGLEFPLDRE